MITNTITNSANSLACTYCLPQEYFEKLSTGYLSDLLGEKIPSYGKSYLLIQALINSIDAIEKDNLREFDALVGDTFCQVRALQIFCIFRDRHFPLAQWKEEAQKTLEELKQLQESKDFNYHEILKKINLPGSILYLVRLYLFTQTKYVKKEGNFVEEETCLVNLRKLVPQGLPKNEISGSFLTKFESENKNIISKISTDFLRLLAKQCGDKDSEYLLGEDYLYKCGHLKRLFFYPATKVSIKAMHVNQVPIVLWVQQRTKDEVLIRESVHYFENDPAKEAFLEKDPFLLIKNRKVIVIKGCTIRENEICAKTLWDVFQLFLYLAANHPENKDMVKDEEIRAIIDKHDKSYMKNKLEGTECTRENPKLLHITHVYCDSVKNIGLIKTDDFLKSKYKKFYEENRSFFESECFFVINKKNPVLTRFLCELKYRIDQRLTVIDHERKLLIRECGFEMKSEEKEFRDPNFHRILKDKLIAFIWKTADKNATQEFDEEEEKFLNHFACWTDAELNDFLKNYPFWNPINIALKHGNPVEFIADHRYYWNNAFLPEVIEFITDDDSKFTDEVINILSDISREVLFSGFAWKEEFYERNIQLAVNGIKKALEIPKFKNRAINLLKILGSTKDDHFRFELSGRKVPRRSLAREALRSVSHIPEVRLVLEGMLLKEHHIECKMDLLSIIYSKPVDEINKEFYEEIGGNPSFTWNFEEFIKSNLDERSKTFTSLLHLVSTSEDRCLKTMATWSLKNYFEREFPGFDIFHSENDRCIFGTEMLIRQKIIIEFLRLLTKCQEGIDREVPVFNSIPNFVEKNSLSKEEIATHLYLDANTQITDDILKKVNLAAVYLKVRGFELMGTKNDEDSFCNAYLGCYKTLSKKIPFLDSESSKNLDSESSKNSDLGYLRGMIASQYLVKEKNSETAKGIANEIRNGKRLALEEGTLLALTPLGIPIKTITVNHNGIVESCTPESLSYLDKNKSEEHILIVDLDGHFIYAKPLSVDAFLRSIGIDIKPMTDDYFRKELISLESIVKNRFKESLREAILYQRVFLLLPGEQSFEILRYLLLYFSSVVGRSITYHIVPSFQKFVDEILLKKRELITSSLRKQFSIGDPELDKCLRREADAMIEMLEDEDWMKNPRLNLNNYSIPFGPYTVNISDCQKFEIKV